MQLERTASQVSLLEVKRRIVRVQPTCRWTFIDLIRLRDACMPEYFLETIYHLARLWHTGAFIRDSFHRRCQSCFRASFPPVRGFFEILPRNRFLSSTSFLAPIQRNWRACTSVKIRFLSRKRSIVFDGQLRCWRFSFKKFNAAIHKFSWLNASVRISQRDALRLYKVFQKRVVWTLTG